MRTKERGSPIPELSMVALTHPHECEGRTLPAGAMGAVVFAYRDGIGYDVALAEPFHCIVPSNETIFAPYEPAAKRGKRHSRRR
jgi:hypothetical protein